MQFVPYEEPAKPLSGTQPPEGRPFAVPSTLYNRHTDTGFRISAVTMLKICLVILGVVLGVYAIYRVLPVLLLVFIAIMLATAIEPLVASLRHGPFSRSQGILVVYTAIFLVLLAIGWLIVPVFISQVSDVLDNLPQSLNDLRSWAVSVHNPFLHEQALNLANALQTLFAGTQAPATGASADQVASVSSVVLSIAEGALSVIIIFVMAFYWMTERARIKRALIALLPADRGNRVRRVWDEIELKVGAWVRGQLTLMALVGAISAVGYFAIGVRYWPALALFIALCEAIPMVGPYIGTAPAILIALVQPGNDGVLAVLGGPPLNGLTRALLVLVFAVLLQTVEGNILLPRIMRNTVGISPLTVVLSLLVGAALAGLPGALLAVPLAGAIQVIVADLQTSAASQAEEEQREATEAAEREALARLVLPVGTELPQPEDEPPPVRPAAKPAATGATPPPGPASARG